MSLAVWLVAVFASGGLSVWLGALAAGYAGAGRVDVHWSERARARWSGLYPVWRARVVSIAAAGVLAVIFVDDGTLVGAFDPLLSCGAAFAGTLVGGRLLRGIEAPRPVSWRARVGGALARVLLLSALLPILVAVAIAPWTWGPRVLVALAAGAASWWWLAAGGATRLLVLTGFATPAPPALRERVLRIARAAGREPGRIVVAEASLANAVVLPQPGDVIVFRPLLEALTEEQVDAVLAHEAGHLAESPRTARLRTVPGYAVLPLGVLPALVDALGPLAIPAAFVVAIGAGVWARRHARALESRADAHAHEADSAAFAHALEAIYRANRIPAVTGGRRTHPDLYDRMLAAGVEPDFPRPAPPSKARKRWGVAVVLVVLVVCDVVGGVAALLLSRSDSRRAHPADVRPPR